MIRGQASMGGAASSCPALWVLLGTMGHIGDNPKDPLREPRHLRGDDGRCKHCGGRS